jgi:formylglycine-generating enzyme required for sulfatase activity
VSNPKPTDNPSRVFRGGSWTNAHPVRVLAIYRNGYPPTYRDGLVGFRTTLAGRTPR